MRVYHLLSAENALNDLALRRIKIARLSELNDPFELLAANMGGPKQVRKALREWKTSLNETKGLLSFSKKWENPVLWSHYGAKHHGMCLGFDIRDDLLQHVDYAPERVLAQFTDGVPAALDETLVGTLLKTKYEHWKYEEEVRVWIGLDKNTIERGLYFYPFSEDLKLREVILGPLCEYPLADVRSLVGRLYQSVPVIKARLAFKYFKVVPDERTIPKLVASGSNK